MKNFIALSLIAFILLCGCKGNSFMTQRYTKLGHTHNKQTVAKKTPEHKQEIIVATNQIENPQTQTSVLTAEATQIKTQEIEKSTTAFPSMLVKPLVNTGKKTFHTLNDELKKSIIENVAPKKTVKEKFQRATGLFNTLFKIVLWCIILAVVVAIIIILVLV